MWKTVAEKLSTFLGQNFMVAYWGPAAIGIGGVFVIIVLIQGFQSTFGWLTGSNTTTTIVFFLGVVIVITMIAYMFASLHHFLLRLYEGYWNNITGIKTLEEKLSSIQKKQARQKDDFLHFPKDRDRIKPTRLGNVLAAAEEYPFEIYRLDAVTWWPRLVTLLPDKMTSAINEAETYMIATLNLSTIFTLLALVGGVITLILTRNWGLSLLLLTGSEGIAWLCYVAAVSQAESFGTLIRTAFDLHRHSILGQMHLPLPQNLVEERLLWTALNEWLNEYKTPWNTTVAGQLSELKDPFYYSRKP